MIPHVFDWPWWGYVLFTLGVTHITIAAVTIYLHRAMAHESVKLHPIVSHFFRFWLWLTTGMHTKEWVAIHRKHHAYADRPGDPHSPIQSGIWRVLFGGAFLYARAADDESTLEKYGRGCPEDWIERHLYTPAKNWGIFLMAGIDVALFGPAVGLAVWAVQMAWIPFWAAGVINGIGHYLGYVNYRVKDFSRNIVPWGILVGGEELHNNHHRYMTSARFATRWWEIDLGWVYIRLLSWLRLAKVRFVAPRGSSTA